jgi:redox-sensitive bicupin YhaK (pirin superfamily)
MWNRIIEQRRKSLGDLEVGRVLPAPASGMVGPFIFFDHIGPVDLPAGLPRTADVRPHPHIGLSTLTYLFDGQIMHRDSLAFSQAIEPGAVNWMVAGNGITHSERFERARAQGDHLHGIQAWVALPNEDEETSPSFSHHPADSLPVAEERGVWMRLIAGQAFGMQSPVRTHSPLAYAHLRLAAGATVPLPAELSERAVYVVSGALAGGGQTIRAGQMGVLEPGTPQGVTALEDSLVMLVAGEPVGPRYIDWNFVSSSADRIAQARSDWRGGRIRLPDADNAEFIPLPETDAIPRKL